MANSINQDKGGANDPVEGLLKNRPKLTVKRTFVGGGNNPKVVRTSQPGAPGSLPFNKWNNSPGVQSPIKTVKMVNPQAGQAPVKTGRNANTNTKQVGARIVRAPQATKIGSRPKR